MKQIQNIQALRGVAVLLVVFFHLTTIEQKYGGSKTILPKILQFGVFGVDLFFVISGFVMVTITRGKFQNLKHASKFLYNRMARIYPTYWVYSLVVLIVFLLQPSWVNNAQGNQVNIVASFLLFPTNTLPLVMVGWTLIHELYFYLIFSLIILIMPEKRLPIAMILWGIVVVILNVYYKSSNHVVTIISHPLTAEFIGGCFLAILYYRKPFRIKSGIALVGAGLFFALSLWGHHWYQNSTGFMEPSDWWRITIFGIPALVIVTCLLYAERNGFTIHSSMVLVGDASYSIYLSHILTLSTLGKVWKTFSFTTVPNIIMIPFFLIATIMVGFLSYRFIEMPLLELCRKIKPSE